MSESELEPTDEPERDEQTAEQSIIASNEQAEATDPNEVSDEELENQDWTLGEQKTEIREKIGMRWKLVEPNDDDTIASLIETMQVNQGSAQALRRWAEEFIVAPKITDERWEEQMTARERFLIGEMVLNFFGIEDFMGSEDDIQQAIAERRRAAAEDE